MYCSVRSFRSRLHLDGYTTYQNLYATVQALVTITYLLAYVNKKNFLRMVNSAKTKKKKSFLTRYNYKLIFRCYEIDHGSISPFFGSIEYTHNSELHIPPLKRHVRARASPLVWIKWDDSFSFRICKIIISIKSHVAVYQAF